MSERVKLSVLGLLIICTFLVCGYVLMKRNNIQNEIREIAYDVNKDSSYTVYIKENTTFVPYFVLTDDYNGNVLLLRKHLLKERLIFNPNKRYSGYYENCNIDSFLNKDFINKLDPGVQNIIRDSKVEITAKSSLGSCGTDTTGITRKVFLLSYTELGLYKNSIPAIEGKALKYFNNPSSLIAYYETGEAGGWWLRTSYTEYDTTALSIGFDATVGDAGVYYTGGVRPAFCVERKTLIETSKEVIKGKTVYILKQ